MSNHKRRQLWEQPTVPESDESTAVEDEPVADGETDGTEAAATLAALRGELDELRTALEALRASVQAQQVNAHNELRSSGRLAQRGDEGYFSPDEVRAMSREAVRDNYDGIVRSMKHWH